MWNSAVCVLWVSIIFGFIGSARAGVSVEYHFMPGTEGQVRGFTQFVEVAPIVGPKSFKVLLTGSLVGSAPSADVNSARAYLDKWGLGVLNPKAGKDVGVQGQVQLDGKNGGEYLRLEFPEPVRLTYLTFSSVGSTDDFELLADGNLVDLDALFPGTGTIKDISGSQGNWPGKVDFTKGTQLLGFAKQWDVRVGSSAYGDGIQLENLGGEEFPEPSTLILWSIGFAAAGIRGVRRRVQAGH
jgi:hypothetical protein